MRRSGPGGKVPRGVSRARIWAFLAAAICAAVLALPAAAGFGKPDAGANRVSIFYYSWYSTPVRDGRWAHWYVEHDGAQVLSTPYFPSRGLYSSSNAKIVAAQMREIAAAGVDTVVVSWWGFDSPENDRLALVAPAAQRQGLEVAIHVEPYRARTPAKAAEDIARLQTEGGYTDFYVFDADRDPAAAWAEALAPLDGVRIFGHTTLVGRAKASGSTASIPTTSSPGTDRCSNDSALRRTPPACCALRRLGQATTHGWQPAMRRSVHASTA